MRITVSGAAIEREPAMGAHLIAARVGYCHHGIYAGGGKVVHYSGFCRRWHSGPVEEVSLAGFAERQPIRIVRHPDPGFTPSEIVERARSRIGEHDYRLLTNNCEHFCNWCISGLSYSDQAERLAGQVARLVIRMLAAAATLLAKLTCGDANLV